MMLIRASNDVITSLTRCAPYIHTSALGMPGKPLQEQIIRSIKASNYLTCSSFDQTFNMDPYRQTGTNKPIGERIMESIPGTEQHRATHGVTRKKNAPR
jgi:hypothetical protein